MREQNKDTFRRILAWTIAGFGILIGGLLLIPGLLVAAPLVWVGMMIEPKSECKKYGC